MALFPRVGREQPRLRIAWWVVIAILAVGILLHLFPFYYMMVTSITPAREVMGPKPSFWPQNPTLVAWQLIWNVATKNSSIGEVRSILEYPYWHYFGNSLFITGMSILLSMPITSFAAYANSKLQRGPVARWSFLFFIGTMFLPAIVSLTASFLLTRNFPFVSAQTPLIPGTKTPFPILRLYDTPWAVIIPSVYAAGNFLLFKAFFDTIPDSIIQAARVDGGSEFNIFRRIVLPMSIPVYAIAIWNQFGGQWESFLWPQLVLKSTDKYTTAIVVYDLIQKFQLSGTVDPQRAQSQSQQMQQLIDAGLSWNGLMVLGLLQSIPIFILFIVCREYMMKGVRIRGLK